VLTHRIFFRGPSDLPFFWLALVFRQAKSTRRLILIFFISSRTTSIESFVQRMMKANFSILDKIDLDGPTASLQEALPDEMDQSYALHRHESPSILMPAFVN
jgi:hypothetical protein